VNSTDAGQSGGIAGLEPRGIIRGYVRKSKFVEDKPKFVTIRTVRLVCCPEIWVSAGDNISSMNTQLQISPSPYIKDGNLSPALFSTSHPLRWMMGLLCP
jgi:hypothetical protein